MTYTTNYITRIIPIAFFIRSFSTTSLPNVNPSIVLDPYFITGFTDASLKSVVVWGSNLQSLVGIGKFTKQVSSMIKLASYQNSVVIGANFIWWMAFFCFKN